MTAFRILLVAIATAIAIYTAIVVAHYGPDLLPIFFGNIAEMRWPGQFNVDFMSFLTLSALWLAWRHHFSALGFVYAVLVFAGGGLFLSLYLLVATIRSKGDMAKVLLGMRRA